MSSSHKPEPITLGFLTVRQHPEHGYFGGYLMLNPNARPLEFHCTLPVKPTRAQAILYGPTLEEFVCGEQIARTLVSKAKLQPQIIFTDIPAVLSLRHVWSDPVCMLDRSGNEANSLAKPSNIGTSLHSFKMADFAVSVLEKYRDDVDAIVSCWKEAGPKLDPTEPFGRIEEALLEAHPTTKAA